MDREIPEKLANMTHKSGTKTVVMRALVLMLALAVSMTFAARPVGALVVTVEAGHTLSQLVDSAAPFHVSQAILDAPGAGDIESIGIDPVTGDVYVQLSSGGFTSATTNIYKVTPAGVVTLVSGGTRFGINSRGTDLHFDPTTGLLVTQDQNSGPQSIVTVDPTTGALGTYAPLPAAFFAGGAFGMDFSLGAGGSVAAPGEVVFTSDGGADGIHHTAFGGPATTFVVTPPTAGDDMVIQPDGDWVHVPDFGGIITAYTPDVTHVATPSATGLNIQGIFATAGLPFVWGSRATVCDTTGDLYISYSGAPGGNGIFRINEALTTATLIVRVSDNEGIQDLTLGRPSHGGASESVYFTVHDFNSGGEEVWEVTVPECPRRVSVGGTTSFLSGGSGTSASAIAATLGTSALAVAILVGGGWYTRRRWLGKRS